MRTTIKDIAKRVGVSNSLVSIYLNNRPLAARIADSTKRKIDEAVKELNYKPSATALALKKGKSQTLGLVIGDICSDHNSFFAQSLLNECSKHGYQLLIGITRFDAEEEKRCLENLISRQADGIFFGMGIFPADYLISSNLNDYPILQLRTAHPDFNSVGRAESDVLKTVIPRFYDLGCRTILIPHNSWAGILEKEAEKYGMKVVGGRNALAHTEDYNRILDIRPDAVAADSSIYVRLLMNCYKKAGISELPYIFYGYSLPSDFIEHPNIIGYSTMDVKENIANIVKRMIQMLEKPNGKISHVELPVRYLEKEQIRSLRDSQLADPFYEPFISKFQYQQGKR